MRRSCFILPILVCLAFATVATAHEVRPAYFELRQTSVDTYDVLWKVPARGDLRLGVYLRMPDNTFNVTEPSGMFSGDAYLERYGVRRPGGLEGQMIRIDGLESTKIDVLARIERIDGVTQTARLLPDSPSFTVEASPSFWAVGTTYLRLGVEHILFGVDHLLFVLVLVLLVRGWKQLAITITTFTVAHSITLAAATLGFVHVPAPPVEACIALSIVFVAAEAVRGREGKPGLTERAPWVVAFTFGLLHGLGFAGALSEVGLPPQAIPAALLFFNVGVELGQLAFVLAVFAMMKLAERVPVPTPAWGWRLAPTAIGGIAMFWVIQRTLEFAG